MASASRSRRARQACGIAALGRAPSSTRLDSRDDEDSPGPDDAHGWPGNGRGSRARASRRSHTVGSAVLRVEGVSTTPTSSGLAQPVAKQATKTAPVPLTMAPFGPRPARSRRAHGRVRGLCSLEPGGTKTFAACGPIGRGERRRSAAPEPARSAPRKLRVRRPRAEEHRAQNPSTTPSDGCRLSTSEVAASESVISSTPTLPTAASSRVSATMMPGEILANTVPSDL